MAKQALNITTPQLTNNKNSEIITNTDLTLDLTLGQNSDRTVDNILNNSGTIKSQSQLDIKGASKISNYSEIFAGGNITIYAFSLINGEDKTQQNDDLIARIQSNQSLKLDLTNLNNRELITAAADLDIIATGNVDNSGIMQSGQKLTASSAVFTNSNLVKAQDNLQISANQIINSNTKSNSDAGNTSKISKGLVSQSALTSLRAAKVDNSSGMIAGNKIKIDYLPNSEQQIYSSSYNISDIFRIAAQTDFNNNDGTIYADNSITLDFGAEGFLNAGNIQAQSLDITANKLVNLGQIRTNDFIKFHATAINSAVSDSGNIINGSANNDTLNRDVLLSAGSYIDLAAKNNINNYGTILANTNLTLTATEGNINNYASNYVEGSAVGGKIQGGSGTTTLNALKGSFNNYNKITVDNSNNPLVSGAAWLYSNNDAVINVANLNNYGEIAAADDLTVNASANLNNNQSSLIWSGEDLILNVANNLVNDRATIYSNKNLTIQKNATEKTNLVQNISGDIEVFGIRNAVTGEIEGDLTIKANTLENKRSIDPGVWLIKPDRSNKPYNYTWDDGQYDLKFINSDLYNWQFLRDRCFGNGCGEYQVQNIAAAPLNSASIAADIVSGAAMTLDGTSILNDTSNILSTTKLTIKATSLINQSKLYPEMIYMKTSGRHNEYTDNAQDFSSDFAAIALNNDAYFAAVIKSAGTVAGSGFTIIKNITIVPNYTKGNSTKFNQITSDPSKAVTDRKVGQITKSTTVNGIDLYTLAESGVIPVDLSNIAAALGANSAAHTSEVSASDVDQTKVDTVLLGQFKVNLTSNPNKPLVESRSQFVDVSKFFGSAYYFTQLGLDGAAVLATLDHQTRNNTRMLGDSFVETTLILDRIRTLTNDSIFLSTSTTDSNQQIKELVDNAIAEFAALGLDAEDVAIKGLTTDQANLLTKDIITFELTTVNGFSTLAPKIYLSQNSRNRLLGSNAALATNATIFGKDIIIDASSADLFNSGSIIASNNLTLNIGSLSSASINSGNLATTSLADIAKIKAGNDLTITANSLSLPIISSSDLSSNVATTFKGLPLGSSSSDITTTTTTSEPTTYSGLNFQNTYLSSGGVTKLSSASNINISNDKNLKLATLSSLIPSLNNGDSGSTDGLLFASSIKDDAAAARSALTFNAGSDIELESAGSINIANNYTNSGGSIFLTATDNINNSNFTISASDNVVMEANNINNIATSNNSNETKIEAGNIVSINAVKAACSGGDDGCSGGYKGGNITNIGATISGGSLVYLTADNNITNKALVQYNINGTNSYSSGLSSGQTSANFSNTTLDNDGISSSDTNVQSSSADHISSTLISQGNITSGGDLVLVAGNNLNNIGSNITSTGSSYLEATNGNINITTAALRDRSVTRWGGRKKGGTSTTDNTTNIASNITSGSSGSGTLELLSNSSSTTGSSASGNINITGSNITSADNLTLTAQNDINITASQDTKYSQTQTWKKGMTVSKSSNSGSSSITNILSELTATNGDISITSNADTNLIGARLKSINLDVNAGDELNIYSVSDQNTSWSSSTKSRSLSSIDGGFGISLIANLTPLTLLGMTLSNQGIDPSDKSTSLSQSADKTSNISSIVEATGTVNLSSNQDLTISGSNISGAAGSLISDQGRVNILAAQEVEKISSSTSETSRKTKVPGFKGVKHTSGESSETITNVASNLTFTDSLLLKTNGNSTSSDQSANINIVGSNLTVSGGDLTLTSAGNIMIANAVDSVSKESSGSKHNEMKKSASTSADYVESALSSNLSATNIILSATTSDDGTVLVQGSNLSSSNNTDINSINTVIRGADLTEYHYAQTSRGYSGIGKVAANLTSTTLGLFGGAFHLMGNILAPIDDGLTRSSTDELFMDNSLYNIKVKTIDNGMKNSIVSSNITVGNNLTINSTKDVTIQASNLKAGTSDTTSDHSDSSIEGKVLIAAENLYIVAGQEFSLDSHETKTTRTLQFNNWSEGSVSTDMINSQITAKSDGFIMNVANQITTSYDSKKFNEVNGTLNDSENNSGLNYLTYLKDNQSNVLYNPIDEIQQQWADASRGLTAAGTAVVVVAAVTATVLTAGAAAPATAAAAAAGTVSVSTTTFVVSTAVVSSAMATASVSAANMSMNVDGDIFKQAKDVSNQTLQDTTSNESLKNMAIAGLTAAATMGISYGISSMSEAANGANAANAANGVNTVNSSGQVANASQFPTALDSVSTSLSYNPSAFNLGSSTSFASNATSATSTVTMTDRFLNAVQNSVVQTVSSSAAQSAVNGDSFTDSLKNSTKNLIINAVGEVGANEIGTSYHTGEISKAQQLTLHAILGCSMAAAGGNNCAAGAASGVVGEEIGSLVYNNTSLNREKTSFVSQVGGALSAAMIAGPDDGNSVFAGSQIGWNAAHNNATYVDKNFKVVGYENDKDKGIYEVTDENNLNKNTKVGYSFTEDQFAGFSGYKDGVYLQDDLNFNQNRFADAVSQNLSKGQLILEAFVNTGSLDLKQQLMISGTTNSHLDGLVVGYRDGLPVYSSVESVVNYTVGRAGYQEFGIGSGLGIKIGTGAYNQKKNGFNLDLINSKYLGETPYAGEMIQQGIASGIKVPAVNQPNFINQQGNTEYQSLVDQYLTKTH